MADFRVIMTLVFKGRSYREIVAAAGCSHRDVSVARKVIADRGIEVYQGSWTGPREWRGCPHVNESAAL